MTADEFVEKLASVAPSIEYLRSYGGLPPFYVPVVMRVYRTYSPCLEQGGA